jgi:hypothetical protein
MKLAEALAERSDCQNRIEEVKKWLIRSARVQEGEQPAEDTAELLGDAERAFARLLELVSAINRTNSKTAFDDRHSISDAIAERDVVGKRRDFLAESRRQEAHGRIAIRSQRCDSLRRCLLESCRRKWISLRRSIVNWTLGCRN